MKPKSRVLVLLLLLSLLLLTPVLAAEPEGEELTEEGKTQQSEAAPPAEDKENMEENAPAEDEENMEENTPAEDEENMEENTPAEDKNAETGTPAEDDENGTENAPAGEITKTLPAEEPVEMETIEGEAHLFQAGYFDGPYTKLGDVTPFSVERFKQRLLEGLIRRDPTVTIENTTVASNELPNIYGTVINDNPQLFYVGGGYSGHYTRNQDGSYTYTINPNYYTALATDEKIQEFELAVQEALKQVNNEMSDFDKALVLHDYIVTACLYNEKVANMGEADYMKDPYVATHAPWSAYGVLVKGDAVCQGYALAYMYLLKECGIDCGMVSSDAINHAWNMVSLNGGMYHVDATWDDPTPNLEGNCRHANFLLSDDGIINTGHYDKITSTTDWDRGKCTNTLYETANHVSIFRDIIHPVHWRAQNSYDWLTNESGRNYTICSGDLKTVKETHGTITVFINKNEEGRYYIGNFGILWLDDMLYYVNDGENLTCRNVRTGRERTVASLAHFTPDTSAPDSITGQVYHTDTMYDAIGLYFKDGKIVANTRNNPDTILGRFDPIKYPPEWEGVSGNQILGLTDGRGQVGVNWTASGSAALWVARYEESGRLKAVKRYDVSLENGLNLFDLDAPLAESEKISLMLLGTNDIPLCGSYTNRS